MKLIAALILFAACMFTGDVSAMWARLSDVELVDQSDIIVSATLVRAERRAMPGSAVSREIGVLQIRQVLKGPAKLGEVHIALPSGDSPLSSSDIRYTTGQKGLWFLRPHPLGSDRVIYDAGHPQRFLPEEAAIPRIAYFRNLINSRKTQ
ncbi:hypothetical protein [Massilia cavernae]|nr:hypothetical protein [Massilia cavernae]